MNQVFVEVFFNSYDFGLSRLVTLSHDLAFKDVMSLLLPNNISYHHMYDVDELNGKICILMKVSSTFCFNDVMYDTGTYIIVL